ncbi:uncharacterized protein LOC142355610 isoform X2 [Convolutriloba macropyga]|uniref:uncharacterized protein LOC142355610 isoform X2 n=1 Tax=Convolutriloba macropyga TaxID=536237 RepID=UPI003F51C5C9
MYQTKLYRYGCEASKELLQLVGKTKVYFVSLGLRKDFEQEPISQRIKEGETMELKCVPPQGTPTPVVEWYKITQTTAPEKEAIDENIEKGVFDEGVHAELMTGGNRRYLMRNNQTFVITPTTIEDSGNFTCVASNVIGHRKSQTVEITIYRNGDWADWSVWSKCELFVRDSICGRGTQSRSRTCTNPQPKNGGNDCEGDRHEEQNCDVKCPDERGWTPWSPWSLCELTPPSITDKVRAGEKTAAESSTSKCNQQRKRDCTLDFLAPDTGQVGVDSKCVGDAYQLRPCDEADCEVVVVAPGGQKDGSGDRTGGTLDDHLFVYMALCILVFSVIAIIIIVLLCLQRQKRKSIRGVTLHNSSLESHHKLSANGNRTSSESYCCCASMFCFGCFCHNSTTKEKYHLQNVNFVNGVPPSCTMNTMHEVSTLGGMNKGPFLQTQSGCASCYNIDIFPVQNIIPSNSHHSLPAAHVNNCLPPNATGAATFHPASNFYLNPPPVPHQLPGPPSASGATCIMTSCCNPGSMNPVPTTIMSPSILNNAARNASFGSLSIANLTFANQTQPNSNSGNVRNASSMKAIEFNSDPRLMGEFAAKSPEYEDPYFESQNEYFDYDHLSKERDFSDDQDSFFKPQFSDQEKLQRDKQLQRRSFCNAPLSDNSSSKNFLTRNNSAKQLPTPQGEDSGFGSFSLTSRNDSSRTFDYNTARGVVGAAGGRISIPDFGASLVVPPNAIESGKKPEISLTVNTTEHYINLISNLSEESTRKILDLPKNATLISPIVTVAPSDVTFLKPLILTLPHFVYTRTAREQSFSNDEFLLDVSDWSLCVIAIGQLSSKSLTVPGNLHKHENFYTSASSVHIVTNSLAPSYCVIGCPKLRSDDAIEVKPTAKRVRVAVFASNSPQCASEDDLIVRVYCFPDLLESWQVRRLNLATI